MYWTAKSLSHLSPFGSKSCMCQGGTFLLETNQAMKNEQYHYLRVPIRRAGSYPITLQGSPLANKSHPCAEDFQTACWCLILNISQESSDIVMSLQHKRQHYNQEELKETQRKIQHQEQRKTPESTITIFSKIREYTAQLK